MSTTDTTVQDGVPDAGEAAPSALPAPRFQTPIVPQATISGRALVAVVAIMTFLASLTSGAAVLVRAAATEWQSDVAREVTIQIRPAASRDMEADVARAAAIARTIPGIADVRPFTKEEAAHLLEPWLGTGLNARRFAGSAHHRGAHRAAQPARSGAIERCTRHRGAGRKPR